MRIGLVGVDGSHAEEYLRLFNSESRFGDIGVTAIWGGTQARTQFLLEAVPGVSAADSLGELIAQVDGVIVGDRHGNLHKAHALPAIAAGKPVFIDKPLACSVADAEAIVDAAARAGVPLLSASALRWQTETRQLKAKLARAGGPLSLAAYGTWYPKNEYGGAIYYGIHTIELVQELIGTSWTNLTLEGNGSPIVRFESGAARVSISFHPLGDSGSSAFGATVASPRLNLDCPIPLGDDYMAPVAEKIAAMLRTGQSSMTREELLAPVKLMAEIDTLLAERKA
jgi:predicted dehydrogenase